jgi:hypothetical protein
MSHLVPLLALLFVVLCVVVKENSRTEETIAAGSTDTTRKVWGGELAQPKGRLIGMVELRLSEA